MLPSHPPSPDRASIPHLQIRHCGRGTTRTKQRIAAVAAVVAHYACLYSARADNFRRPGDKRRQQGVMPGMDEQGLVAVPEAAKMLNRSTEQVRRYLREGRLQGRRIGGQWFIERAAVDHFF